MSKQYTAYVDVDTLIIHAALAGQETNVIVTHNKTCWQKQFKNQTEFWGHFKKKEGGWLSKLNESKLTKGLSPVSADEFTLEPIVSLVTDVDAEMIVKGRFKAKIESIVSQDWCKDYKICFGTGKNFRYDIAQTVPYKSSRPAKPILYDVVKEYMLYKYSDNMLIVDGVETDEIVTSEIYSSWLRSGKDFDKVDSVACFIDKDLAQYSCLHYNFDKPELGLQKIDGLRAAKNLAKQMVKGDTIDSIPGLPELPEFMFEKYNIRRPGKKGLGEKTAEALLESCDNYIEVYARVVEAYKGYYGEVKKPFVSFRGEKSERNWLDHLNEQYRLLRMRSVVNEDVGHVSKFLENVGL